MKQTRLLVNIKECCLAKSSTEKSSSGRPLVLSTYPSGMLLSDVVVIIASSAVKDAIAGSTSTIFKLTQLNQILNCCCRVCAVSIIVIPLYKRQTENSHL